MCAMPKREIRIVGATGNNLKSVSAAFPIGLFTCVTGVSGSGKSTLVNDTLFAADLATPGTDRSRPAQGREGDRPGTHRSRHRHRPESHRSHAPLKSRHLHGTVCTAARTVRAGARVTRPRLRSGSIQFQRQGRPLRGLPGRRRHPRRDAFPARMCTCPAMCARDSATTARRWRSAIAARPSTMYWR